MMHKSETSANDATPLAEGSEEAISETYTLAPLTLTRQSRPLNRLKRDTGSNAKRDYEKRQGANPF